METKVKVKSLISSRVLLSVPDLRLRRVWEKKGAVKVIPLDQLEEAMYNPGVEARFRDGALGIDDIPMHEFRQKVKELPQEQLMELANYAIEHEIADFDKSELLLKLTDIDIISAIKLNRADKEVMQEA